MGRVLSAAELEGSTVVDAPRRVLSAADLEGSEVVPDPTAAPPKKEVSRTESLLRGARAGVTFGFGDELAGALDLVLGKKSYTEGRDEARVADKAAKDANPGTYLAGELGGGLASAVIPGGAIVKGAGLAANVARGVGAGVLAGIGQSEAELTKGNVAGVAKDAAVSGLIGGATGGVLGAVSNKLIGGAAARVEAAETAGLKEGLQYSTKLKTFGKATPEAPEGQFTKAIKTALKSEPEIKAATRADPHKALGLVDEKVNKLTERLDEIYEKAAAGGEQVPISAVREALKGVQKKFGSTTATEGMANEVERVSERLAEKFPGRKFRPPAPAPVPAPPPPPPSGMDDLFAAARKVDAPLSKEAKILAELGERPAQDDLLAAARRVDLGKAAGPVPKAVRTPKPPRPPLQSEPGSVPFQGLREEYRAWQDIANKSSKLFSAKSPKEEVSEEMANALRETLQSHLETVAKANPGLGISRAELQGLNREVSTWLKVQKALTEKASRLNIDAPPMGGVVGALTGLLKSPVKTAGAALAKTALPADMAVARLVMAAKGGNKAAQAALRALGQGVPRAVAANAQEIPGGLLSAAASPFLPSDEPY